MRTLMRHKFSAFSVAAIFAASVVPSSYVANAVEQERSWSDEATVSVEPPESQHGGVAPRSAGGTTWAPGGALASNSVYVNGRGLHVDNATVTYQVGTDYGNACTDSFEIAYYEGGQRKVETAGGYCNPIRSSHRFDINRSLDDGSAFCARSMVGGSWSNYACVKIHS